MDASAPIVPLVTSGEKYDVFLSFRGPDTRKGFADCLFESLKDAGFLVFMDDEELRVGESIAGGIEKAIYDSKLFIPIFSRDFASSKWCLKEIAWMTNCMEEFPGKKEMLPVFYDVGASDVKLKTDLYAEALLEHENTSGHETVERWRKALIKVPEVKGWNLTDAQGQGKLIRQIVQHISRRLELKHRILPDHFIGIEQQVQDVMDALDCGSRDVRIMVIHGMGGIGKTTLASAVFNKICCQFQSCSFISNVRESSARNGIVNLQNKLLRDTLRFSSHNFCDENDAMNCIQSSLRNKDVLVVLDDVSDMDQIRKLVGMGDWVGLGSRVIITTRNLSCVANVNEIESNAAILQGKKIYVYQMRELGFDNSLQLLCLHAFCQYAPPNGYEQLSVDILSFTRGVPLALEVIGSYLKGKRTAIWKEILNKLKKVPHERLYQEILMSSYEMLSDEEKEIFLDIAFFFAGHDKTSAFYYWDACDLLPEMSVDTLISYALVKINYSNRFRMHDLLRDLGREVVRKQSNGNLGRRSRLCNEDAKRVLSKRLGTEYVRALKLDSALAHNFTPAELSGLSGLRFLELCGGNFIGEFEDGCMSELQWLSWRDCALDFRGTNFYLENLVILRLSDSNITETWPGWEPFKTAKNLKVLELDRLKLTTTPGLSSFLSLKRFVVHQYRCVLHIDNSIGNLKCLDSLEIINRSEWSFFCTPNQVFQLPSSICNLNALSRLVIKGFKMKQLPKNIGELKGLKFMEITECEFLRNLPDSIGKLESLCKLVLFNDGISELPESIGRLRNLTELNVSHNQLRSLPATIGDLDRLEKLDASHNNDLEGYGITELPESIGKLRNLTKMNVSNNRLKSVPATIGDLERLEELDVSHNSDLRGEIPGEFGKLQSLRHLDLSGTGIHGLPSSIVQLSRLESLDLRDCEEFQELPDLPTCLTSLHITSLTPKAIPDHSSPNNLQKWLDLIVDPSPMTPDSSSEVVHIDPSISNLECLNSPEMINCPWLPANLSLGKSHREVFHIPSSFCNLKALSRLVIKGSKMKQLPENIGELKGLKFMEIMECEFLRNLPDSIGDLESLCELVLFNDGISELPESIGRLRNLTELNVSHNRLRSLPATIGDLDKLEKLDASHNNDLEGYGITELPESIGKLKKLTELDVSNNRLKSLPATIGDLERLEKLDASHNSDLQGEIPHEFGKLQSLRYLDLSGTGIHGLPSSVVQLSRLESLDLENCNEIQELPNLPACLTRLEISSGSLKAVPDLSSLTNLVGLGLSNRDDDDEGQRGDNSRVLTGNMMMAWIQHLQELEYLKVDLSPMPPYLSAGLDQLSQLTSLELSCPSPSVVSLPSGLEDLSLYHSMSLSSWERLSNLECLSSLGLYKSIATEIRLDGLESLKNLSHLEIDGCEFLERVHGISRLQNLRVLDLSDCPKLMEIRGLVQLLRSLQRLQIQCCDSIRCLPRPSSTESPPSKLHLSVVKCRELRDFFGPYDSYFTGGEQ